MLLRDYKSVILFIILLPFMSFGQEIKSSQQSSKVDIEYIKRGIYKCWNHENTSKQLSFDIYAKSMDSLALDRAYREKIRPIELKREQLVKRMEAYLDLKEENLSLRAELLKEADKIMAEENKFSEEKAQLDRLQEELEHLKKEEEIEDKFYKNGCLGQRKNYSSQSEAIRIYIDSLCAKSAHEWCNDK